MYDWRFVNLHTPTDFTLYQNWDKAMDLYYWIFALVVTLKWKDVFAKKLAWSLFAYRLTGMVLFWITGNRIFLFIFPNIFENFFIFYLLFEFIFKKRVQISSFKIVATLIIILVIPKLIHEYFLHFLQKQPWEFYDIGKYLGFSGFLGEYTNYLSWGGLFYLLPILSGLIYINKLQRGRR